MRFYQVIKQLELKQIYLDYFNNIARTNLSKFCEQLPDLYPRLELHLILFTVYFSILFRSGLNILL
jgi:hypothetical protein